MPLPEQVVADYQTLRLSLKAHPMAFLRRPRRPGLRHRRGIARRPTVGASPRGPRARPPAAGSAKGVCFITLEDETGTANVVVWPKVLEANRRTIMQSRLLVVEGYVQREYVERSSTSWPSGWPTAPTRCCASPRGPRAAALARRRGEQGPCRARPARPSPTTGSGHPQGCPRHPQEPGLSLKEGSRKPKWGDCDRQTVGVQAEALPDQGLTPRRLKRGPGQTLRPPLDDGADAGREGLHGEGLGEQLHAGLEEAAGDGGVLGVAGDEQHLQPGPQRAGGVGELAAVEPGRPTSVISRSMRAADCRMRRPGRAVDGLEGA